MVPVGFARKSSSGLPKRAGTSVTAFARSGPIFVADSMPKLLTSWQTKQVCLTKNAPSPVSICCSFAFSSGVGKSPSLIPAINCIGNGVLFQLITNMLSACASRVLKPKVGITVPGAIALGSFNLLCARRTRTSTPIRREVVVLLGGLVAFIRKIRANHASAAIDFVTRATSFLLDQGFGFIDVGGARRFAVIAVAQVTVELHRCATVAHGVSLAHILCQQRLFPVLEIGCMGGIHGRCSSPGRHGNWCSHKPQSDVFPGSRGCECGMVQTHSRIPSTRRPDGRSCSGPHGSDRAPRSAAVRSVLLRPGGTIALQDHVVKFLLVRFPFRAEVVGVHQHRDKQNSRPAYEDPDDVPVPFRHRTFLLLRTASESPATAATANTSAMRGRA